MSRLPIVILGSLALAACNSSSENAASNQASANMAEAQEPKGPHCFFKDADMKGWAATREKDGNIAVTGKAYREDPRYKAAIGKLATGPAKVIVWPTIGQNDTGYGAPDNWWDLKVVVPNSAALDTVDVKCGDKLVTELKVPLKKS